MAYVPEIDEDADDPVIDDDEPEDPREKRGGDDDDENSEAWATALVETLVEEGGIELVNDWGRRTLVERVQPVLEGDDSLERLTERVSERLLDAPEVADLFIEDDELYELLKRIVGEREES